MKITIESTTRIVDMVMRRDGIETVIQGRVWEGETERGVKVQCIIQRIAAQKDQDLTQFAEELKEQRPPSAEVSAFPLRMIL